MPSCLLLPLGSLSYVSCQKCKWRLLKWSTAWLMYVLDHRSLAKSKRTTTEFAIRKLHLKTKKKKRIKKLWKCTAIRSVSFASKRPCSSRFIYRQHWLLASIRNTLRIRYAKCRSLQIISHVFIFVFFCIHVHQMKASILGILCNAFALPRLGTCEVLANRFEPGIPIFC